MKKSTQTVLCLAIFALAACNVQPHNWANTPHEFKCSDQDIKDFENNPLKSPVLDPDTSMSTQQVNEDIKLESKQTGTGITSLFAVEVVLPDGKPHDSQNFLAAASALKDYAAANKVFTDRFTIGCMTSQGALKELTHEQRRQLVALRAMALEVADHLKKLTTLKDSMSVQEDILKSMGLDVLHTDQWITVLQSKTAEERMNIKVQLDNYWDALMGCEGKPTEGYFGYIYRHIKNHKSLQNTFAEELAAIQSLSDRATLIVATIDWIENNH